ncbi:MAG: SGNH/GDSL hydrolase family protein [Streptococcaceae bacterium]|jgi:lysophospholipase L1-like esterase|nr:SGNH/GDSL hydrolase family protein [Streptococcaceae bacterium]
MKKIIGRIGVVAVFAILTFTILSFTFPTARQKLFANDEFQVESVIHYVAVGDSLTAGVGDSTNSGGFVSIVSKLMQDDYGERVLSENFGVSGNTSKQILERIQTEKIRKSLRQANLITLTVGGNDLLQVIRENLNKLTVETFDQPRVLFQSHLTKIILNIREENKNGPIYIIGIYNPYYLNFQNIPEMQEVVDLWNKGSEDVATAYRRVHFIPINDLLSKGIEGGETKVTGENTTVQNDALFSGDQFHPNDTGYQLMANIVMKEIQQSEKEWQKD